MIFLQGCDNRLNGDPNTVLMSFTKKVHNVPQMKTFEVFISNLTKKYGDRGNGHILSN